MNLARNDPSPLRKWRDDHRVSREALLRLLGKTEAREALMDLSLVEAGVQSIDGVFFPAELAKIPEDVVMDHRAWEAGRPRVARQ